VKRLLLVLVFAVVVAAAVWFFLLRDSGDSAPPVQHKPRAVAVIGSGSSAVGVSADGVILSGQPAPADSSLPQMPATAELPKGGHLAGPMLQQARVLGAVPPALRPYVASSYYGESGVDVELSSGIELRFGDASQAARKWKAAAAVLADPSITALDYVDLHAPSRPAIYGEGHSLPPAP
jgi:cell division septal protein FtsQ